MGLIGSMSVPNGVTTKPMIVLTALAFMGFGFYKRYFPSEPPAEELSSEPRPSADATPPLEHEATVARASDPKRRVTRE
jgi:hypothetical protein